MNVRELMVRSSLRTVVQVLVKHSRARRLLFDQIEARLRSEVTRYGNGCNPQQAVSDRLDCLAGLLDGLDRIIGRGLVSPHVLQYMLEAFLGNVILNRDSTRAVRELGFTPPSFITISPTGVCNLRCANCYAADAALRGSHLSFRSFDRLLREKRELWGSHFTVVSGGEPFLWQDDGYDLLKLAKRHEHDVFMVYTNGTLVTDEVASRIADAGNVTPAISVEGFEAETDARRGEGVYSKILKAFEHLRNHGVPFGISATAGRNNWNLLTSDDFASFYFEQQGALYGWMFQYMPMGRGQSLDLMVPPEERVVMAERMWNLVRKHRIFLIDFWNSGTASLGCISAARPGGYFHINWDGDIMPCVFTPYAAGNINDIYARGGSLQDVISLPFFSRLRKWQQEHGFGREASEVENWLCPCAIRDHFSEFAEIATETGARPINTEAQQALTDRDYYEGMVAYGREIHGLTDPLWRRDYLHAPEDNHGEDDEIDREVLGGVREES